MTLRRGQAEQIFKKYVDFESKYPIEGILNNYALEEISVEYGVGSDELFKEVVDFWAFEFIEGFDSRGLAYNIEGWEWKGKKTFENPTTLLKAVSDYYTLSIKNVVRLSINRKGNFYTTRYSIHRFLNGDYDPYDVYRRVENNNLLGLFDFIQDKEGKEMPKLISYYKKIKSSVDLSTKTDSIFLSTISEFLGKDIDESSEISVEFKVIHGEFDDFRNMKLDGKPISKPITPDLSDFLLFIIGNPLIYANTDTEAEAALIYSDLGLVVKGYEYEDFTLIDEKKL